MLELLKGAARAGERTGSKALPENTLTFELVYKEKPNIESEKGRLEKLLGGEGFDLFYYSESDDPTILLLKFPQIERQQSSGFLFNTAAQLKDSLGLLAVTPEVDALWSDTETSAPGTEGIGDTIWKLCRSDAPSPSDPDWTRRSVRADKAMNEFGIDGSGILVGQPDTGVAQHHEIGQGLRVDLGYNFVDDSSDPTDPLSLDMGSPGHGTATSSCVISRSDHIITGTAPGASLVPIRCVDKVVIGSGFAVAKAVDHARNNGCHIITMSLGGAVPSFSLKRAIKRAVDADMIVMSAAGNCVKFVVYPAWDGNTIAVAAVDENDGKWKGSSSGSSVDIAAPGENVHVARRRAIAIGSTPPPEDLEKIDVNGQGTSYAVATTAGCAALWLEHHGVAKIKDEARSRSVSVQELFREVLRQTARKPGGWDTDSMGAGIVDAHALVELDLKDIGKPTGSKDAHPAIFAFEKNVESAALQQEAGHIAMDWLIRQDYGRAADLESVIAARPTDELQKIIGLAELPNPASIVSPQTPPTSPTDALLTLVTSVKPGLARVDHTSVANAIDSIQPSDVNDIMDRVNGSIMDPAFDHESDSDSEMHEEALQDLDGTLAAIANGSPADTEDIINSISMLGPNTEAVVLLTGRPVLPTALNGMKDWSGSGNDDVLVGPRAGDWAGELFPRRKEWRKIVNAVGRIDIEGADGWRHAGTGFVVAPGVVMTNRHVVQAFAEPIPVGPGTQQFELQRNASIIFDSVAKNDNTRFKIKRVITSGAKRIGLTVDISALDMALVEIETDNGHGTHPDPITFSTTSTADIERSFVLVAGYPARPNHTSAPADKATRLQYWDRLHELFGGKYGVKYIAPGQIIKRPGQLPGDVNSWTFAHDATTLGGNSGSSIFTLDDDMKLCGLHFGGSTLSMNLAHDLKQAIALGDRTFSLDGLALS